MTKRNKLYVVELTEKQVEFLTVIIGNIADSTDDKPVERDAKRVYHRCIDAKPKSKSRRVKR